MSKLLVIVDMQNDFVNGSLGTNEARRIVPGVLDKVKKASENKVEIIFTRDTHGQEYFATQEGKRFPVVHCMEGTAGWELIDELKPYVKTVINKPTFGSEELVHYVVQRKYTDIQVIGVCTDICVVSNVLLLKAALPEARILVDASCCAGVTPESHEAALITMQMCQVEITGWGK